MSKTMRAAVVQADKTVKVEEVAIPIPEADEILVKVISAALNQTDWKHVVYLNKPGSISGADFVGIVVDIGGDVPADKVPIGQLRVGFTRGGCKPNGSFAEYVAVPWYATFVGPSNLTTLQLSSAAIPAFTAVQGLHSILGLPEPGEDKSKVAGKWFLVWSGGSAVGQYAIQLGRIAGMKVAATASPKNYEKLKAIGASIVVDYKDPNVVDKLKAATSDGIIYAIDCRASGPSAQLTQRAFGPSGGSLATVTPDYDELPRDDVKATATLIYTVLGRDVWFWDELIKPTKENVDHNARWQPIFTKLFESGELKPIETIDFGGLDNIQKGMNMMRDGSLPGKVAFTI